MINDLIIFCENRQQATKADLDNITEKITSAVEKNTCLQKYIALLDIQEEVYDYGIKFVPHYICRLIANFAIFCFFVSVIFVATYPLITEGSRQEEQVHIINKTTEYIKKTHPELASVRIDADEILTYIQPKVIQNDLPALLDPPTTETHKESGWFSKVIQIVGSVLIMSILSLSLFAFYFLGHSENYQRYREIKKAYKAYRRALWFFVDPFEFWQAINEKREKYQLTH